MHGEVNDDNGCEFDVPFAAFLVWLAPRASERQGVVRLIVAGNLLWVVASILLLVSGSVDLTPFGTAFVVLQAVVVAVFAYLEDQRGQSRLIGFKRL